MNTAVQHGQISGNSNFDILAGLRNMVSGTAKKRTTLPEHGAIHIFAPCNMVDLAFYPPSEVRIAYHSSFGADCRVDESSARQKRNAFEDRLLRGKVDQRRKGVASKYASSIIPRGPHGGWTDAEMRKLLPRNHISTIESIAEMIYRQRGGTSGFLPTHKHSAAVCYVRGAGWDPTVYALFITFRDGEWLVNATKRVPDIEWCEGFHVIYPDPE